MPAGPPLDPDRDQARSWLEEELGRGDYQLRESFVARAWRWFTDLLDRLGSPGALPTWATWVLLGLVLVAVLAVLAFAARDRWRAARLARQPATGSVLEGARRSSAEHRTAARSALAAGDHDTAVVEGYRALTTGSLERTLLDDRPGRTAHEVATDLAPVFPEHGPALGTAARAFDAVRYGGRRAGPEQADQVVELDDRLQQARTGLDGEPAEPAGAGR